MVGCVAADCVCAGHLHAAGVCAGHGGVRARMSACALSQIVDVPRAIGLVAGSSTECVSAVNMNERGDSHVSFTALDIAGALMRALCECGCAFYAKRMRALWVAGVLREVCARLFFQFLRTASCWPSQPIRASFLCTRLEQARSCGMRRFYIHTHTVEVAVWSRPRRLVGHTSGDMATPRLAWHARGAYVVCSSAAHSHAFRWCVCASFPRDCSGA